LKQTRSLAIDCWIGTHLTVKASVYGSAWNESGAVTAVSIVTTEGDELFVVSDAVGDELLKLVSKTLKPPALSSVSHGRPRQTYVALQDDPPFSPGSDSGDRCAVLRLPKIFGFDFHRLIRPDATGDLRFLKHALIEDR